MNGFLFCPSHLAVHFADFPLSPVCCNPQELEIVLGDEHISFTTSKIGALADVSKSKFVTSPSCPLSRPHINMPLTFESRSTQGPGGPALLLLSCAGSALLCVCAHGHALQDHAHLESSPPSPLPQSPSSAMNGTSSIAICFLGCVCGGTDYLRIWLRAVMAASCACPTMPPALHLCSS